MEDYYVKELGIFLKNSDQINLIKKRCQTYEMDMYNENFRLHKTFYFPINIDINILNEENGKTISPLRAFD